MKPTFPRPQSGRTMSPLFTSVLAFSIALATVIPTHAQTNLVKLSTDTFHDSDAQHHTEVEPDTFAWGSTIVSGFQVARISGGGGADVGFATSTDSGKTWTSGYLPGLTDNYKGGSFTAASDAAVAYDAKHGMWLISTLPLTSGVDTRHPGARVVVVGSGLVHLPHHPGVRRHRPDRG